MAIGDFTRVNTNISAFNTFNYLKTINYNLGKSQLKLATGNRINETADNPADFTISTRLEARTRGLKAALNNIGIAKDVLSVAEGGLLSISDILLTMKEKVTIAATDTLDIKARTAVRKEILEFREEIEDIVKETTFAKQGLMDGTYVDKKYQTGERPGNVTDSSIKHDLQYFLPETYGQSFLPSPIGLFGSDYFDPTVLDLDLSHEQAISALESIDNAIETVSKKLSEIGALQNRLTVKESTVQTSIVNTKAAKSRILDADIAQEQVNSTKLQILQQSTMAQLAQANTTPQFVLALFQ